MFMVYEELSFLGLKDFCKKARFVKKKYADLMICDKRVYKLYVYSNLLLTEHQADIIWEYLNEPFGSVYYISYQALKEYSFSSRI